MERTHINCIKCKSFCKVPLFCNSCFQNAKSKAKREGFVEGQRKAFKEARALLCDFELNRIDKIIKVQNLLDKKIKGLV